MAKLARAGIPPTLLEDGTLEEAGFVALLNETEQLRNGDREFLVELVDGLSRTVAESGKSVMKQIAAIPRL